ncbi:hypothetical protein C900_03510 [Fulvivirga imtechensis AK7]|uniref:Uncharacterized protein n=1 Tax=Fulvivirga imtechensis AK7 TaxID=1237149 RepID=L8JTY0_9BACT|nr:hypothetical protein C900_03510 [Fulvivirga imtechensis AK7]
MAFLDLRKNSGLTAYRFFTHLPGNCCLIRFLPDDFFYS